MSIDHGNYNRYGLLLSALIALGSGCMTSPNNGDLILVTSRPVRFQGYLQEPGKPVRIEYYNFETERWLRVSWGSAGISSDRAVYWSDDSWYPWDAGSHAIPRAGWAPVPGQSGLHAKVRAVTQHGQNLFTFDDNFDEVWDPDMDVGTLWQAAGHGGEATIYALSD